jgi:BlaI family penicillinase repressor
LIKNIGIMQRLTNKEEEIMKILWKLKRAFVKEIRAELKGDKPHYNTLSTIVRNLEEKNYVSYEAFGNTHRYYPLVTKDSYRKRFISNTLAEYYDNSYKSMVSFFAKEQKISIEELREIIELIEKEN